MVLACSSWLSLCQGCLKNWTGFNLQVRATLTVGVDQNCLNSALILIHKQARVHTHTHTPETFAHNFLPFTWNL